MFLHFFTLEVDSFLQTDGVGYEREMAACQSGVFMFAELSVLSVFGVSGVSGLQV